MNCSSIVFTCFHFQKMPFPSKQKASGNESESIGISLNNFLIIHNIFCVPEGTYFKARKSPGAIRDTERYCCTALCKKAAQGLIQRIKMKRGWEFAMNVVNFLKKVHAQKVFYTRLFLLFLQICPEHSRKHRNIFDRQSVFSTWKW